MKLSEAILKGAAQRPQAYGRYFVAYCATPSGYKFRSCALGAAAEGYLGSDFLSDGTSANFDFKEISYALDELAVPFQQRKFECPARHCLLRRMTYWDVLSMIAHLNDQHQWTRERIAAWVAEQERDA